MMMNTLERLFNNNDKVDIISENGSSNSKIIDIEALHNKMHKKHFR